MQEISLLAFLVYCLFLQYGLQNRSMLCWLAVLQADLPVSPCSTPPRGPVPRDLLTAAPRGSVPRDLLTAAPRGSVPRDLLTATP